MSGATGGTIAPGSDTSAIALHEGRSSGAFGRQAKYLLDWLGDHPRDDGYTRAELAKETGVRLQSVCGRIFDLKVCDRVREGGRRDCKATGKSAHPIYLAEAA